jgi:putative transposase
MSTAWSIIHSWYQNYKQGHRKRTMPVVKREFMRIKQTLFRWDGNNSLQISIFPHTFVYVDLSHHWFPFGNKLGEPILTPTEIHLPFHYPDSPKQDQKIAWDSNFHSFDGYSSETGWIQVDIKPLHTIHDTYHDKYRHLNQIYARNKHKGKLLYKKYKARERHRVNDYLHRVAKRMAKLADVHGFESLKKTQMTKKSRNFNRKLSDTDWRKCVQYLALSATITYIDPYYSSKTCSVCGYVNQDLTTEHVLHCPHCNIRIDRQHNAGRNLYQRMNGVTVRFSRSESGIPAIGEEMSGLDELARAHDELMIPKQRLVIPLKCNGS